MSCTSHSPEASWASTVEIGSEVWPGVRYTVRRMSLAVRNTLVRCIRELAQKAEYHSAGDSVDDRLQASALAGEIDAAYIRCGLVRVDGLTIDGAAVTPELLISGGPEALAHEIAGAVKAQCSLSEDERKN